MSRFLMTTTGSEGCVTPFVRLAAALRQRGHEVFLFTHHPFRERFARSGVTLIPFDTEGEYEAFIADGVLLNDPRTAAECFRRHFIPCVGRECALMEEVGAGPETVLVTSETPGISARLMAERWRARCVSVLLYPAHASTMPAYEEFLWRRFAPDLRRLREDLGLPALSALRPWWRSPRLHLAMWPAWFASVSVGAVERLEHGGFLWQDDAPEEEVEESLSHLQPTVLMTSGTGNFGDRSFFARCVEACHRLGLEPLLVGRALRPDGGGLAGAPWIPSVPSLARLMRRSRVVVHHGGLGTVGQALAAGIPQLIGAFGGDRPNNGSLVEALGAGAFLPKYRWSVDEISTALSRLLDEGEMALRCRSLSGRLAGGAGVARACDALEATAEVGVR
jgi:rhamnosyltransferase subunit B